MLVGLFFGGSFLKRLKIMSKLSEATRNNITHAVIMHLRHCSNEIEQSKRLRMDDLALYWSREYRLTYKALVKFTGLEYNEYKPENRRELVGIPRDDEKVETNEAEK